MTVMAVFQDVDKCMRCNGCVIACKREWNMKLPTNINSVKPQKSIVSASKRLAIKSQKRGDMGPFIRFTCWHCPDPPCATGCPLGAIKKEASGAVSVNSAVCNPDICNGTKPGPKPCEFECQRGGYPKVGEAYESGAYAGLDKMNKCTLCTGRAGADSDPNLDADTALPTRARKVGADFISDISGTAVPELAHEPACVASCPAKAMKWDSRDNIIAYLNDSANGFLWGAGTEAPGTKNWVGNGSMFWASKKVLLGPPKADPFIEDHLAPMTESLLTGSGKLLLPTLVIGGLAALSARRNANESLTGEEA